MKENGEAASSRPKAKKRGSVATDGDAGSDMSSIEKIRELVFGSQMEEYEKRFDVLGRQLAASSAELRDELTERLDSIQSSLTEDIAGLKKQLADERKERVSTHEAVLGRLGESAEELAGELRKVEKRLDKGQQALTEDMQAHLGTLEEEIAAKAVQLRTAMDEGMEDLKESKLDRRALADAMSQIVGRLVGGDAAE